MPEQGPRGIGTNQRAVPGLTVLIISLYTLTPTVASGGSGNEASTFEAANRLYEQGAYSEAASAYQTLIQQGHESAAVYFNLGNAYFKSDKVGRAIANYRLAGCIAPRDPDITANLRFARNSRDDGLLPDEAFANRFSGIVTSNELTAFSALALWAWAALMIASRLRPAIHESIKRYMVAAGTLLILVLVGCAWMISARSLLPSAVAIAPEVVVRFGPLEESQSYYAVQDGAELTVVDRKDDWLQVKDAADRIGWIHRDQVIEVPCG